MDDYDTRGTGWLAFAGAMILLVGLLNTIFGIAAIAKNGWRSCHRQRVPVSW